MLLVKMRITVSIESVTSVYREKISLWLLYGVQHSVIMADFETQQPIIVIILIIYSLYLLKNLVELEYISGRIASY